MSVWSELARPQPAPPDLLHRGALTPGAWTGLLRDGAYRAIGWDAAVRADLVCDARLRARAIAGRVPSRATVGRASAAWVHLGGHPPMRLELLVGPGARRVDPRPDLLSHEAALSPQDVQVLDDVSVTSVQRTGIDLARYPDGAVTDPLLVALVAIGFDIPAALAALAGLGRARGIHQAAVRLRRLDADGGLPRGLRAGDAVDVVDALHLAHRGQDGGQMRRLGHLEDEPRQRHPVT